MKEKVLKAYGVRKRYSNSNFTLDIPEVVLDVGSITGVVGENGNGKTTLLQSLAGELHAEGEFGFYGADKKPGHALDWIRIKSQMAFIPQRIPRWYGSLWENLSLKAALSGIPADEIDKELEDLIEFLGLTNYKDYKWTEISTGFRLRFELARMLIGKPKLLVLDEPLANLDLNTQERFLSDLKNLLAQRSKETAIILSSQQLHELEAVADQMIVIKDGKRVNTDSIPETDSTLLEIMAQDADRLKSWLGENGITYKEGGSHLTCILERKTREEFLQEALSASLGIHYFRDITRSAKRHL
jgi:ABC-2 type transport system ATP-binding protein